MQKMREQSWSEFLDKEKENLVFVNEKGFMFTGFIRVKNQMGF